jgi:tetratricopeptide (TPR) repeat protein
MPFPWAIVVIPGAMGTLVALRGRDKTARRFRMLVWYTLAVAATLLVFFVTSRYRLPLIVPAALLAGYGVERTMRAVRSRDVRGAATLVLAGAGAAWASLRDPGVRADPALELVAVGAAFENRGDHANALRATDEALRRNPNIAGAWHNRALALEELGRSEEALESLEQATRIDPALGPAWQTKGVILARAGRIEEAIDPFRRAAELMPHSADALENLARALGETGRCAEALEAGRRALDAGARAIAPEVAEWEECARRASAPGSR